MKLWVASLLLSTGALAKEPPSEVVLVKGGEVIAYQEVAEEFSERCRVVARIINMSEAKAGAGHASFGPRTVVVTIGQEALDAVEPLPVGWIVPTLAFHVPDRALKLPGPGSENELLLRALARLGPRLHNVGLIYGPRSAGQIARAAQAAKAAGLELVAVKVEDGPDAVRALRRLARQVHALWLPADADVVTPQVFQFALRLQLESGLPIAASTRQQVHSGALIAVDHSPRAAGWAAAELVNSVFDGRNAPSIVREDPRITVNAVAARRLGADVRALAALGAHFE